MYRRLCRRLHFQTRRFLAGACRNARSLRCRAPRPTAAMPSPQARDVRAAQHRRRYDMSFSSRGNACRHMRSLLRRLRAFSADILQVLRYCILISPPSDIFHLALARLFLSFSRGFLRLFPHVFIMPAIKDVDFFEYDGFLHSLIKERQGR